ncbi:MAG: transglutaminase N-terminal domain-containing protein [Planctomycetaceae bacterium]
MTARSGPIRAGNGSPPGLARYDVRHETCYTYSEVVPVCHNEIHLVPRDLPTQRLLSSFVTVDPQPDHVSTHVDSFGNTAGIFAIDEPHGRLVVTSTSRVEVDPPRDWTSFPPVPWEAIRDRLRRDTDPATLEARQFTDQSPLIRISPQLAAWTAESFPPERPWAEAVVDLTRRIHHDFTYDPAATTTGTTVDEVFALRRGVCQDFAHLQIACLRSLGLAARYVSGYLSNERRVQGTDGEGAFEAGMVGADASHAWLAVWGGDDGWLDLDPTNDCTAGTLHVTVAWGRDYADVSPVKGVCVGGGRHEIRVAVHVTRIA